MEAPPVQFATTSDGVSIAWAEAGQGPALLQCLAPFSHVREGYAVYRAVFEAFTQSFRLVSFDGRGIGLSERDAAGVSAETLLLDAQTVIDAAKLDRFIVYAGGGSILALSTCLRLATAFPERVTHVVLECPYQNMRELVDTPFGRTSAALAELDWTVYVQTLVRVLIVPDAASGDFVDLAAKLIGGWVDPSVGLRYAREMETIDVGDLLAQVSQPTLVLRHEPFFVPARSCQRVAAKIPGAQFLQYSDPTFVQQVELIRDFVGAPAPLPPPAPERVSQSIPSGTAIILFADIADSTALTERLGDTAFRDKAHDLDGALRAVIRENAGMPIEGPTLGDGILATFSSARQAIQAALGCGRAGDDAGLPLHLGLHAGDVIRESDPDGRSNVYGGAVNIASRISGLSVPGETLVSGTVRDLARTSAGVTFKDRGDQSLKGVSEPVRVWAVVSGQH
jgi:class 3 adenylate cyclase/pimeloyl-ACP methyl ester carboxylesterase